MLVLGAQAKNTESCLPCSSLLSEQRLYAEKGNSRRPEPLPLLSASLTEQEINSKAENINETKVKALIWHKAFDETKLL